MTIYAGRIRAEFGRHVKTAFFASRIWIFAGRIRRKQMNQDSAGGIPAESGQNPTDIGRNHLAGEGVGSDPKRPTLKFHVSLT